MKIKPVPFTAVRIEDRFWKPRKETNRQVTVWHCLKMLEESGALDNYRHAAARKREGFRGFVFADSDVYKVLEGASMLLATEPEPELDAHLDEIVRLVANAQWPDGYINTFYSINKPDNRFSNLRDDHELYCAGHLFEAAAAHFEATGKRSLLDVATRFANLLCSRFGGSAQNGYGGHPELELALIKLWRVTGQQRYFELAQKQIQDRGSRYFAEEHGIPEAEYDGTYHQDDVPIAEHRHIKGHAVRAAYLMCGVTDLVSEIDAPDWVEMLGYVWRNTVEKRMYVTGGIGTSSKNEGFTVDYDLPNNTAYQETCASIALAMWGWRMGLYLRDAAYFDVVESALYNAALAGVSLDGSRFFYVNPLSSDGRHSRKEWFDCACCPPNILRTIASVGSYAYGSSNDSVFVNLYLPGSAKIDVGGKQVALDVEGDYPWNGEVDLTMRLDGPAEFAMHLRIPGWADPDACRVNGEPVTTEHGYAVVRRQWKNGDRINLLLPMQVQFLSAHPLVSADIGQVAVRRGPLVYCAEEIDLAFAPIELLARRDSELSSRWQPIGGYVELVGVGRREPLSEWSRRLYGPPPRRSPAELKLIPYAYWANRGDGGMQVWLRHEQP